MKKESTSQKTDWNKFLRMWDRKTMKLWLRAIKNRSRSFNIYQVEISDKKRESETEIIFKKKLYLRIF